METKTIRSDRETGDEGDRAYKGLVEGDGYVAKADKADKEVRQSPPDIASVARGKGREARLPGHAIMTSTDKHDRQ
jgi:hypothetical protein